MNRDQYVYDFEKELYKSYVEKEITESTFEFAKTVVNQMKNEISIVEEVKNKNE